MSKTYRTNNKLTSFPYPSVPRSPVLSDRNHYNNNFESQRLHTYTAPYSNLTVSSPQKNDYSLNPGARQNTKPSQTKTLYTLSSSTKNPGLPSFSSYQLNSIANRRETPAVTKPVDNKTQKHAVRPRLQLNLGEIDMGIEEFPDGPITVDQRKMINSHTPLESPKIKTLRGINEGFGVNMLYSVRSVTNRTKKIMFPSESGFDKENCKKDSYTNDYMFYGSKSSIMEDSSQKYKEVFLDEKILKTVSGFLNCRDIVYFKSVLYEFRHEKKYAKIFKKRMFELMAVGLGDKDQYYFWDSLIHFRRIRDLYPSTFTAQFVKDCPYMKDILKDLDRTLPEYEKYSTMEGKEALLKVLVALANTIKDIGYIQGLNAIAGVFLFHLNEEKSYWITLYMMEKVKMKNILREDFNKVHVLNYQLKTFLENYIPDVATYLNQRGVDISDYTTCWFITLFSYFLTLQNTIKAWNFLFINGNAFLIQLGLAVFSRYKDKILNMDVDNLGSFFKYDLQEISANDNTLFEEAVRFHVSNRLMNDLEYYYNKGKPQLKLIKDFYNKYQWRPLDENVSFKNITTTARRPKFHLDLSSHKDIKSNQSSETRRLGSPTSALEKGKDFVQNIVQTITIDLPEALKGIFVKSPTTTDRLNTTDRHRNISIAENILIPSQVTQSSTLTSIQVGSRALQDIDSNYDLKPMEKPKPVMNSMELVINKENKRKKCRSEKKQKKEPSIRVVNLTAATVETEDNESILQPATAEKVRPSKEVALVEMKNRLMNKKRMNIGNGNIGGANYSTKSRLNVENIQNIQFPKTEEGGFFSPRFHNRHNH